MNCRKCADRMSDYIDECLGGAALSAFEAHIAGCAPCASRLKDMREMIGTLAGLGGAAMPVDCWSLVASRLQPQPARVPLWGRALRPVFAVPALAAVIVAALIIFGAGNFGRGPSYVTAPEIERYLSAHSSLEAQQSMVDPDVAIVTAELEKVSLVSGSGRP